LRFALKLCVQKTVNPNIKDNRQLFLFSASASRLHESLKQSTNKHKMAKVLHSKEILLKEKIFDWYIWIVLEIECMEPKENRLAHFLRVFLKGKW